MISVTLVPWAPEKSPSSCRYRSAHLAVVRRRHELDLREGAGHVTFPARCAPSIRTPAANGRGSGCSPPPAAMWMQSRASNGVIWVVFAKGGPKHAADCLLAVHMHVLQPQLSAISSGMLPRATLVRGRGHPSGACGGHMLASASAARFRAPLLLRYAERRFVPAQFTSQKGSEGWANR
jgi:hypothetical protein